MCAGTESVGSPHGGGKKRRRTCVSFQMMDWRRRSSADETLFPQSICDRKSRRNGGKGIQSELRSV